MYSVSLFFNHAHASLHVSFNKLVILCSSLIVLAVSNSENHYITDFIGYNVYYSSCPTDKFHGRLAHIANIYKYYDYYYRETLSCKCGDEFNLYYEQVEAGRNYRSAIKNCTDVIIMTVYYKCNI